MFGRRSLRTSRRRYYQIKFRDNLDRHCEIFLKCCKEWALDEAKYPGYLKETLTDEALNFSHQLTESDPNISWDRI